MQGFDTSFFLEQIEERKDVSRIFGKRKASVKLNHHGTGDQLLCSKYAVLRDLISLVSTNTTGCGHEENFKFVPIMMHV